jgi:tetratricopeptide (TPR) repeat protein
MRNASANTSLLWSQSDPSAAVLGNASLLGAGYLLLGRLGLAVVSVAVTAALLAAIELSEQPAWFWRVVLGLWWAFQIGHVWRLANGRTRLASPPPQAPLRAVGEGVRTSVPTQRFFAVTALVLVLVPALAVRADASRIEQTAADSHGADDCAAADAVAAALTVGHRLANGLPAARTETVRDACAKVAQAEDDLTEASTPVGVATEFDLLQDALDEAPQLQDEVDGLLDRFVASLAERDSCETLRIADWLAHRSADGPLGRAAEAVPEFTPDALLGCGQAQFYQGMREGARDLYERLLEEYPDDPRVTEAESRIDAIDAEIELEELVSLTTGVAGGTPPYCDRQAPYRGAAPYDGSAPQATMLFGDPKGVESLPASWLTTDPAEAVLIICAEYAGTGAYVESCEYEGGYTVDFHKQQIDLRLFEVRTGELVDERSIELDGSCPYFLSYYGSVPETETVFVSESSYRDAYRPVIDP